MNCRAWLRNMNGLLYAEVLFLTNHAFPPCPPQHMTFHMDLGRCKHFTSHYSHGHNAPYGLTFSAKKFLSKLGISAFQHSNLHGVSIDHCSHCLRWFSGHLSPASKLIQPSLWFWRLIASRAAKSSLPLMESSRETSPQTKRNGVKINSVPDWSMYFSGGTQVL